MEKNVLNGHIKVLLTEGPVSDFQVILKEIQIQDRNYYYINKEKKCILFLEEVCYIITTLSFLTLTFSILGKIFS